MKFDKYSYLWPPRPDKAIARNFLSFYERRGFVGQIKMNGTCNVLGVSPDRQILAKTRHGPTADHKLWSPIPETAVDFSKLPGKGWYVFVAELMHSKVPGIRNVNYVNDILVADGEFLFGSTFTARQEILFNLLLKGRKGKSKEMLSHWEISPFLWLAKTFTNGFGDIFDSLNRPEHEGIVLKDPKALLALCNKKDSNSMWQVKIRRPHKNYTF